MKKDNTQKVPISWKVQLSRLFGQNSREAQKDNRTPAEWKKTLKKILDELYQYLEENVHTDEMHTLMLYSCLYAAHEALKEKDFWPGYLEGITRLSFLLMGDYPDHRRRRGGKKKKNHYRLNYMRSIIYTQSMSQKVRTMLAAPKVSLPGFDIDVRSALSLFREETGLSATYKDKEFIRWFKKRYPNEYSSLF